MRHNYQPDNPITYTVSKQFTFEAAHRLHNLPDNHKCNRPHGHSYVVEVVAQSDTLDSRGFVLDYGEFHPLKKYIDDYLDHRDLNEVFNCQTSAENIAAFLFDWCKGVWPQVIGVRVSETRNTWAEVWQDDE